MSKRILVILGHPRRDSLCGAIANAYMEDAKAAGNEIRQIFLGDLSFDPVLHNGYSTIQELEPDLVAGQTANYLGTTHREFWAGQRQQPATTGEVADSGKGIWKP